MRQAELRKKRTSQALKTPTKQKPCSAIVSEALLDSMSSVYLVPQCKLDWGREI